MAARSPADVAQPLLAVAGGEGGAVKKGERSKGRRTVDAYNAGAMECMKAAAAR